MSSFSSLQPAPSASRERAAASSSATASATEGGEASERLAAESRSESDSDGERAVRDGPARTESCDTMSAPRPITLSERAEQPRPRTRRQPPKAARRARRQLSSRAAAGSELELGICDRCVVRAAPPPHWAASSRGWGRASVVVAAASPDAAPDKVIRAAKAILATTVGVGDGAVLDIAAGHLW